jgi:hypothetical protein
MPGAMPANHVLTAYFDTNIYDEIYKGKIEPKVLFELGIAVGRGRLRVLLSETVVEELAAVVGTDPSGADGRVRLATTLTCWREVGLVRTHAELLLGGLDALEHATAPPGTFKSGAIVRKLAGVLASPDPAAAQRFLAGLKRQKAEFMYTNREAAGELRKKFEPLVGASPPSFDDFWRWLRPQKLSVVLGRVGEHVTIAAAAHFPPLLAAAGVAASLMFAQTVERRAAKRGDSRDLHHAVIASAAQVFVTHDAEFARRLVRVPGLSFRVASLTELVAILSPPPDATPLAGA